MAQQSIWEQQQGESGEWFERFLTFKLLGASRSLTAAYNEDGIKKGRSKSKSAPPGWRKASKQWNWTKRADAWDKHQHGKTEERWEKTNAEWDKRRFDQRQKGWALSQALIARAEEMLTYPLTYQIFFPDGLDEEDTQGVKHLDRLLGVHAQELRGVVMRGGVAIVLPVRWSMRDASLYLETAQKLADAATGEKQKLGELEALNVLAEAGWIPSSIIDLAQGKAEELRDAVRAAFEGGQSNGV